MSETIKALMCSFSWHYPGEKVGEQYICKWCGKEFIFREEKIWKAIRQKKS